MRLSLLASVLVILCVVVQAQSDIIPPIPVCEKLTCARTGNDCDANVTCAWGNTCFNGKCVQSEYGTRCATDADCGVLQLRCNVLTHMCVDVPHAGPGEDCSYNDDCLNGNTCEKGKCALRKAGELCEINKGQCEFGFYCIGFCTPYIPLDSVCHASPSVVSIERQCGAHTCIPVNSSASNEGECGKLYSRKNGEPCFVNSHCESTLCDGQKCIAYEKPSLSQCKDISECSNSEICSCDYRDGTAKCMSKYHPEPEGCKEQHVELLRCMEKKKCSFLSIDDNSCVAEHCGAEYGCYVEKCANPQFKNRFFQTLPDSCLPDLLEGQCKGPARKPRISREYKIAIIVVSVAIGLVLVGVVIYYLQKSRRTDNYQVIR